MIHSWALGTSLPQRSMFLLREVSELYLLSVIAPSVMEKPSSAARALASLLLMPLKRNQGSKEFLNSFPCSDHSRELGFHSNGKQKHGQSLLSQFFKDAFAWKIVRALGQVASLISTDIYSPVLNWSVRVSIQAIHGSLQPHANHFTGKMSQGCSEV